MKKRSIQTWVSWLDFPTPRLPRPPQKWERPGFRSVKSLVDSGFSLLNEWLLEASGYPILHFSDLYRTPRLRILLVHRIGQATSGRPLCVERPAKVEEGGFSR